MKSIGKKIDKKLRHYIRMPKTIFKYGFKENKNSPRYIFHHIPKCGGTSAVDALTNWFVVLKDYPSGWCVEDNPAVYQKFCDRAKNLDKIKSYQLLVGHYHAEKSFLDQRYPDWQDKGYRLFTFLRHPLELQISLYFFDIRKQRISADTPMEQRLLLRQNFISRLIRCDESNYQEVLQQYYFIGIVEKYQESFDRLSKLIGKPSIKLKIYNETQRQQYNLSRDFVAEFKARNSLDYKIYNYSKNLFETHHQNKLVLPTV